MKISTSALKLLDKSIDNLLLKVDNENKKWLKSSGFPEGQQKIMLQSMNQFEKAYHSFLLVIEKDVIHFLKSQESNKVKKAQNKVMTGLAIVLQDFLKSKDASYAKKLNDIYSAFSNPLMSNVANIVASEMAKDKKAESLSVQANKWLDAHTIKFSNQVQKTTYEAVINAIKNSKDINDAIQKLRELPEFDWKRARATARTETIAASNGGTLEGWRQSDVIGGKEWMCANSSNSRDTHKAADGQIVLLEDPFIVGGCKLMHPADSSLGANAEEVVNCRCTMRAVRKSKMVALGYDMKGGDNDE